MEEEIKAAMDSVAQVMLVAEKTALKVGIAAKMPKAGLAGLMYSIHKNALEAINVLFERDEDFKEIRAMVNDGVDIEVMLHKASRGGGRRNETMVEKLEGLFDGSRSRILEEEVRVLARGGDGVFAEVHQNRRGKKQRSESVRGEHAVLSE